MSKKDETPEVTYEMIEAGVDALQKAADADEPSETDAVVDIFVAMMKAAPKKNETTEEIGA